MSHDQGTLSRRRTMAPEILGLSRCYNLSQTTLSKSTTNQGRVGQREDKIKFVGILCFQTTDLASLGFLCMIAQDLAAKVTSVIANTSSEHDDRMPSVSYPPSRINLGLDGSHNLPPSKPSREAGVHDLLIARR